MDFSNQPILPQLEMYAALLRIVGIFGIITPPVLIIFLIEKFFKKKNTNAQKKQKYSVEVYWMDRFDRTSLDGWPLNFLRAIFLCVYSFILYNVLQNIEAPIPAIRLILRSIALAPLFWILYLSLSNIYFFFARKSEEFHLAGGYRWYSKR